MASISLPPFLEKLRTIANTTPAQIAGWSEDGKHFLIHSNQFEKKILRDHFRGSRQTFIRQLHFYCFKKLDNRGEKWAFYHPKFQRDAPHLIYEIKRKTRTENGGPASKVEVQSVRAEVDALKRKMQKDMQALKKELSAALLEIEKGKCTCKCSCISDKGSLVRKKPLKATSPNKKRKLDVKKELEFVPFGNTKLPFDPVQVDENELSLLENEIHVFSLDKQGDALNFENDFLGIDILEDCQINKTVEIADYFAAQAEGQFLNPMDKSTTVWMTGKDGEKINFGIRAFGGFILKFVESTRSLSSRNMLHTFDELHGEETRATLSRFGSMTPLRELVETASPYVSRVLLAMLNEIPLGNENQADTRPFAPADFKDRVFLTFSKHKEKKLVTGSEFQRFLSFLLEASLMPEDVIKKYSVGKKSKIYSFEASCFKEDVQVLAAIAFSNLNKSNVFSKVDACD